MTLRTKIQIFLSALMIVFILLLNGSVYFLYQNRMSENEIDRVKSDAIQIMEALAKQDKIAADTNTKELLQAFLPANGLIRIFREDGEFLNRTTADGKFFDWPYHYTTKEEITLSKDKNGNSYVQVATPIIWNDGSVVTLQVSEALYSMDDTLSTLQFVLFVASFFMLIPAIIAGIVLARYITIPIKKLTNEMKNNPKNGRWEKLTNLHSTKDELGEMQLSYNKMIDRIYENIEKQERFVSDASHELKTPLSVITSYTELLQRRGKDRPELWEEATNAILSEAERMKQLTEQMLLLAKNQEQENIRFELVDISSIIRSIIRSLSVAYDREIILYTDQVNTEISADKQKIYQAIYILVDNACKYSDSDIHLQVKEGPTELTISVKDFGEGLSKEDQQHIFDRFYRVDKARSRKSGGTGLGLAICHSIIQAHGGTITIESELNEGSTFTIHLPK
ncbi:HAMP domain-containing sensor histidine kinase [Gracilibacillus dipsosauri]|uniref:Signal transduction histidine-protein kinase ArlS n=1 Tax=Gracilibacillus dipsosauri TaxID=178340 RepID=A0A317L3B5_9BACI|nr:HAMP domain-containing histidine kinase [Gracilibacillus dipsosauri]PWU70145.1 HAMP domain-containing protein [Gracilibacillus dipsosauri]